jgi:hypothetical protein
MRFYLSFIYIAFFLSVQVVSGQYYETGQDPASLKWMQIKTNRFTVIYPEKYGSGGVAYAKSLDEAYSKLVSIFPEKKFNIPVIIHNYTVQSNGYVAWAPKRMELYPTPEQNTIPLSPEKQLALHELAHVFQMESLNNGFSRVMSFFFGQQFTGIVASLLPLWFLEGDAVFAESALSESGRGRSPSFQKQLKAITVEKGICYNYDKVLNGSFRDFVPDHYQSGYQMVTWAMTKHDPQIWNKVLKYTAEQPFTIVPVNLSLSENAGLTKKKLFNETFDSLKTIWTKDISEANANLYEPLNPSKKGKYINYYSPVFAGTDSIIAIKTSLSASPEFVLINTSQKTEKILFRPGQIYPYFISYANDKLVWVENQSDMRWENREYSVIKLMDLKSQKTIRLSRKTRYLAAAVSPDGSKIAAIENTTSNINSIILINTETGAVLQSVLSPGNAYLQHPQWADGGDKITVISLTENGEGILSYSTESQKWDSLVSPGREDLQSSFLRKDSLFYISSRSGTDNIYLRTSDGNISSLTRSRFGASDLSLYGGKLLFSDYSSSGNIICVATLATNKGSVKDNVSSASFLINRFDIKTDSSDNSGTLYTPEPYKKWQHLFLFHSWMPFYADIEEIKTDPTSVRPGISFMTQNQLSTLISSVGYEYSQEKNHVFHSRVTWKGWYPVVESQLDYGDDPIINKMGLQVSNPSGIQTGMKFSNTISLPLNFSSGKFTEYLRPSITSDYRNEYIYLKDVVGSGGTYDYGQTVLSGRLYFSNYRRSAIRDIYPGIAQTIDLNYSYAPFDKIIYGSEISLKTAFYFPGIFPNNGIKIRLEKEKQSPAKFLFGNRVLFPRGYKNMLSKEIEFLSVDYVMPIAYPDFNVSSLLYLKRIRTGLFYDYVSGTGNYYLDKIAGGVISDYYHNYKETFRSFGFELIADFHIFRIPYMISGGVQTAWKGINEKPSVELMFSIDLFGMTIGKSPL